MTIEILSILFSLFGLLMAAVIISLFARYLNGRSRIVAIAAFIGWLLYASLLGSFGIVALKTPPGPVFLIVPVVLFVVAFLTRDARAREFASAMPASLLIGLQTFRVFVELALYELCQLRLVPRSLTFDGGNLDILIGLSAPLAAYLLAKQKVSPAAARVWNFVGIATLANVVFRAILTSAQGSNRALGIFPFTYIPGFLAPLALCLHILALRRKS